MGCKNPARPIEQGTPAAHHLKPAWLIVPMLQLTHPEAWVPNTLMNWYGFHQCNGIDLKQAKHSFQQRLAWES